METESPQKLPVSVIKKLHEVQKEVTRLAKEGRNDAQGYSYLQESQIAETFKDLFEKNGLFFTYSSSIDEVRPSPSGKQLVTDVTIHYQFVDVETGEYIDGFVAGQGSDATDKGVYKGITGAVKYIFMKTFLIPTGDDPENDSRGSARRANAVDDVPFPSESDEVD